ncbi:MAG: hypothetical protein AAGI48_13370 [Verrucomicrobiota bacterium]
MRIICCLVVPLLIVPLYADQEIERFKAEKRELFTSLMSSADRHVLGGVVLRCRLDASQRTKDEEGSRSILFFRLEVEKGFTIQSLRNSSELLGNFEEERVKLTEYIDDLPVHPSWSENYSKELPGLACWWMDSVGIGGDGRPIVKLNCVLSEEVDGNYFVGYIERSVLHSNGGYPRVRITPNVGTRAKNKEEQPASRPNKPQ